MTMPVVSEKSTATYVPQWEGRPVTSWTAFHETRTRAALLQSVRVSEVSAR